MLENKLQLANVWGETAGGGFALLSKHEFQQEQVMPPNLSVDQMKLFAKHERFSK